jgi:Flp pilus assembly protein TadB
MTCGMVLIALLLAGAVAGFLHTAAAWPIMTASLVFLAMVLTFLLGIYAGYDHASRHRRRFSHQSPDVLVRPGDQLVRSH